LGALQLSPQLLNPGPFLIDAHALSLLSVGSDVNSLRVVCPVAAHTDDVASRVPLHRGPLDDVRAVLALGDRLDLAVRVRLERLLAVVLPARALGDLDGLVTLDHQLASVAAHLDYGVGDIQSARTRGQGHAHADLDPLGVLA